MSNDDEYLQGHGKTGIEPLSASWGSETLTTPSNAQDSHCKSNGHMGPVVRFLI